MSRKIQMASWRGGGGGSILDQHHSFVASVSGQVRSVFNVHIQSKLL